MNRPLLSICIPTYNRAPFLRACLESITKQLTDISEGKVEIVIADNASHDDTTSVVNSFQNSAIRYFRNEENLGFDKSFVKLLQFSQGVYCLCLGDDDALANNSIAKIIAILDKNQDVGLFWVNNLGYDFTLTQPLRSRPNLDIVDNQNYPSLYSYIHAHNTPLSLVGMFVGLSNQLLKRDVWVAYPEKELFTNTQAVHMYVNLIVFKQMPFMIIAEPFIKARGSNIRWGVFAGLETINKRIKATTDTAVWIKNQYDLPGSRFNIFLRCFLNQYWGTTKEVIKKMLTTFRLQPIIQLYRHLRNSL